MAAPAAVVEAACPLALDDAKEAPEAADAAMTESEMSMLHLRAVATAIAVAAVAEAVESRAILQRSKACRTAATASGGRCWH